MPLPSARHSLARSSLLAKTAVAPERDRCRSAYNISAMARSPGASFWGRHQIPRKISPLGIANLGSTIGSTIAAPAAGPDCSTIGLPLTAASSRRPASHSAYAATMESLAMPFVCRLIMTRAASRGQCQK